MISPHRTGLLFFTSFVLLLLLLAPESAPATSDAISEFSFHFQCFSLGNLTLLGDSYLHDGSVGLTHQSHLPCSRRGPPSSTSPTRATPPPRSPRTFSFSITNANPISYGDGFAFLLAPLEWDLGDPGGFLGLANSSTCYGSGFIAVEFDTRSNERIGDPGPNHIGLDIGSLVSYKALEITPHGIDLKSGNLITSTTTKDFHNSQVIGTIHRVALEESDSGTLFTMKRSKRTAHQHKRDFLTELSIIARLRHKNLVQLQGWCAKRGELLLVYESMPNGNLDQVLHSGSPMLPWCHRYNVVFGVASALMYLHKE
ncbi:putative L-type lectin-domain containing receptor kinase S.7 [Acorus calamus]|uniref:non-specific serine/threonine protein kinase n=1 Tax=Acorus calamus TaxID=4465 RepID=A0AAV9C6I7_ACOCL|nr:putative L-type lectin-domain containing receptor kinase S.7 [Acorus calamus]